MVLFGQKNSEYWRPAVTRSSEAGVCQRHDYQGSHQRRRSQTLYDHATKDDPQYEIKSIKNDHIAIPKGYIEKGIKIETPTPEKQHK